MMYAKLALVLVLLMSPEPVPAWKADTVKAWARTLGDELWKLSEALTKSDQIRIKYKQMNASVKKKDGKLILQSSLRSVSTMLTRKINAVKCIHATAERLAREFEYVVMNETETDFPFEYCSAKYSHFTDEKDVELPIRDNAPKFALDNPHYKNISVERDSHFYDINVNTDMSCVHVPTNIFYRENDALNAILWSEELEEILTKNYKSDPSLSWQYFGSSRGILRFYPAMQWNQNQVDIYDCRVKSWYIEAATCSKDVIILFDVSGSMTGFKNYVARRTLRSLLDTLSNNDYINVYTFKNVTAEVVQCFTDFVQATPENLQTISNTLEPTDNGKKHKVPLEGHANLTLAYITAFTKLKEKRQHFNCNVSSTQGCNQLIMVITDYVPGNLTEVFDEHNRETVGNMTHIPVRVFTFLIGKEVTNVREIQWMACLNRGYFVHIHSVEEVQQQVLKYINVIARPMILAGQEPPPTWTHANIDHTRTTLWNVSRDVYKPDEDKLVTSVAIPAFDYRYNEEHNDDAILLGVAGTDVPIDSIAKLAQPHQLGVNGYSFIVSNNGFLLLHPLLITSINGELQENYNSVDFVEVEQVDDGKGPRELGDEIQRLRRKLVDGVEGSEPHIKVLFHYDNMRRIARVEHDYFFQALENTPFSMGISLPRGYGDTELLLKDNPLEAKQGQELTGINVTDYFTTSFRVHPDWVYCKYHYLEGHESETAELEIWKFLVRISKNELDITKKQYNEEPKKREFSVETHCGDANVPLGKDDYYCNEDLAKQLVFDAKLSNPYFKSWEVDKKYRKLSDKYSVSVRFIATSSGLTRWHYISDDKKNERVDNEGKRTKDYNGKVFGDYFYNAIEETWYKAAVLQHMINKESIVISTPLLTLDETIKEPLPIRNEDGDVNITASYAIFYKDGESETPASVVGFQFSHKSFTERFKNITQNNKGSNELSCNETYKCYLVDSSGYVVVSTTPDDVAKFLGVIQPFVLQSLMDKRIYEHVEVYNYQALCRLSILKEPNSAWSFGSPFSLAKTFFRWLMTEFILQLSDIHNWHRYAYAAVVTSDENDETTTLPPPRDAKEKPTPKEDEPVFSCDHKISLYILNQSYFLNTISPVIYEDERGKCNPAYWAAYVSKTNLLMVVVNDEGNYGFDDCAIPPDTTPVPTGASTTSREPCHKLDLGKLHRRRLEDCYTYHDKERNITACGLGSITRANLLVLGVLALLAAVASRIF